MNPGNGIETPLFWVVFDYLVGDFLLMNPGNGIETKPTFLKPRGRKKKFPINESRQRDWNRRRQDLRHACNPYFLLMNPGNGIETSQKGTHYRAALSRISY